MAPLRLVAQQSAPAATPTSASSSSPVSAPSAQQSEKDEYNDYRHTALVQSLAKMFHLDVETTAQIFEFINFAIIVLAVGIPLFRFLPKVIRKRSETLHNNIESARKVTEDANSRLSAVEAKLSSLDQEIAKFRNEVEQEIAQDGVRIKATIEEESARIVAAAEQEIAAAAAHAQRGLRHFAADLAIDQAAKQMVLTAETDRALIAEFVSGLAKGGQN
jgi:F-type H+-transporting ATPase subunit b